MSRRRIQTLSMLAGLGLAQAMPTGSIAAETLVEGTWITPEQAEMTIEPCGSALCGKLSKIVITEQHVQQYGADATSIKVEDLTDMFNEDPALKDRPMLGLQILTLRATDNPWRFEGEIYNPRDGKTYAGSMEVMGADTVVLKGCALIVLCQEQTWTRVEPEATAVVE